MMLTSFIIIILNIIKIYSKCTQNIISKLGFKQARSKSICYLKPFYYHFCVYKVEHTNMKRYRFLTSLPLPSSFITLKIFFVTMVRLYEKLKFFSHAGKCFTDTTTKVTTISTRLFKTEYTKSQNGDRFI